ncbi:unnamed protein product [Effrenium voratum]|uniref:Uncharacterized protein n=1 Tax=Effrenium voratum TaxID=2562239 RepID=A0AA36INY5_9DINO|nr:unnamed protein product [Effrenium voratum]
MHETILANCSAERRMGSTVPLRRLVEAELGKIDAAAGRSQAGKLSSVERNAVTFLCLTTEPVRRKLHCIWGDEKVAHSAIPTEYLDIKGPARFLLETTVPEEKAEWRERTAPSEERILLWLDRMAEAFSWRLREAYEKAERPAMDSVAHKFRDGEPEVVYRTACMFLESNPDQVALMSQERQQEMLQEFLRGKIHSMVASAKAMDPTYRPRTHLRFLREALSMSEGDQQALQAEEAQAEASRNSQKAMLLELVRVRLDGARTEFAQRVSQIADHDEQNAVKRMESKEAAHEALSHMLEAHLQQLYTAGTMTRSEKDAATVELKKAKVATIHRPSWRRFMEAAGRTAAEMPLPEGVPAADPHTMLRVNVIDCCAMGPTHTQLYPEMVEDAAKEAATFPATFLGICKLPNVASRSSKSSDPEQAVEEAQSSVLEKLKEGSNHFRVQVVQIHYDAESVKSPKRKYWHPLAIFVSDERDAEGKPVSLFTRRPRSEYKHWTADCSSVANVMSSAGDNEVTDLRQHHSGVGLNSQLLRACLSGFSTKLTAHIRDWTPADDCLSRACMALNAEKPRELPRLAYTATAWEHFLQVGAGKRLIENLNVAMTANLRRMVINKDYELPGLRAEDYQALLGEADSGNPAAADSTLPMPRKIYVCIPRKSSQQWELPILEKEIAKWKADMPAMVADIDSLVSQHNQAANPSGTAYALAEEKEGDHQPEPDLPLDRSKLLEDLPQQPKTVAEMPGQVFEVKATKTLTLISNSCHDLFVTASEDLMLDPNTTMFTVRGKWLFREKADQALQEAGQAFSAKLTPDSTVLSEDSARKASPVLADMPTTCMPLQKYVQELARRNFVHPKLMGHTIGRKDGSTQYEVTPAGSNAFEAVPPKGRLPKPTVQNFSTFAALPILLAADRVELVPRVSFNPDNNTIELGFPGVHAARPVALLAGSLCCLALNPNRNAKPAKEDESGAESEGDDGGPEKRVKKRRRRTPKQMALTPKRARKAKAPKAT